MTAVPGLRRHRDFTLLWAGQTVSDVGTTVSAVVIPLVAVVSLRASALEVGLLSAVEWLPWLLIGLPAGVLVDRRAKRGLLIGCDLVRLVAIGSVPLAAAADVLSIGQLFTAAFVTGLATVLFQVAYQSYLPTLVPRADLPEGNAKLQGSQAVASVVGPGLGGLLVHLVRAPFALVVDALSYAVSAAALVAISAREERVDRVADRSVRREIAEGARFVRADPILRVLTISPTIGNLFFMGMQAVVVVFLVRTVGVAPSTVGVLFAVIGLGAVVGAAVARPIARRIGTARALWLSIVVSSPFGLLIPLTTRGAGLALFVVGNVVMLAGVLVYNVTIGSFRQAYCPPRLLGRVVASMRFLLFGSMPVGAVLGGALATASDPRTALWILMLGNLVPILVLVRSPLPGLRDLPERRDSAATA